MKWILLTKSRISFVHKINVSRNNCVMKFANNTDNNGTLFLHFFIHKIQVMLLLLFISFLVSLDACL